MGNDSPSRLIAGAMSGTSADGVDVALTRVTGRGLDMRAQLVRHHHRPYDAALRGAIFHLRDTGRASLAELARLAREISMTYALAVNEALVGANVKASDLAAVAAGGQGAPLVPFADYLLFRHPTKNRVLLNIGGIANLTWLKSGGTLDDVIAFDTGPGNCLSDHVCRTHVPNGPGHDPGGQLARLGKLSRDALDKLMRDPFVRAKPPKSTDGPALIKLFESIEELRDASFYDRLANATVFAAGAIHLAIAAFLPGKPDELIVSGGGTKNFTMMAHLRGQFQGEVLTTDDAGVPSDAKEAIAFALLAAATLDGEPSNVPSVTGAKRPVVLGSITPRP